MYGPTTQCSSKTYYHMFQLSATVPHLYPQRSINDRLLDA